MPYQFKRKTGRTIMYNRGAIIMQFRRILKFDNTLDCRSIVRIPATPNYCGHIAAGSFAIFPKILNCTTE